MAIEEATEVKLYDETKVRVQLKRLAFCFSLAVDADDDRDGQNVDSAVRSLKEGHKLYQQTTGAHGKLESELNEDETAYMRIQFMKIAAKKVKAIGWQTPSEVIIRAAKTLEAEGQEIILECMK